MAIHQCPRCELRFISSSEVEWHLIEDHGSRALATHSAASAPGPTRSPPRAVGPEADSTGSTGRAAIENTVRNVVLLGAVGVSIVACGGLLGGPQRCPPRL